MGNKTNSAILDNRYSFTRNDLQPGHVVELRNGEYRIVMPVGTSGSLVLLRPDRIWKYLSSWSVTLEAKDARFCYGNGNPTKKGEDYARELDIVAVYGFVCGTEYYDCIGDLSSAHRPCLWKRLEAKKMTVAEISEALGYPVEIVEG